MKAANNDKKKVIVLAALGAVLLGVGAFSMTGGGAPAPAPAEAAKEEQQSEAAAAAEAIEEQESPFASAPLPQRDPFAPQIAKRDANAPVAGSTPPPAAQSGTPLAPMDVPAPPMPPMPGDVASLPNPGPTGNGPDQIAGQGAPSEPIGPSFRLTGVVLSEQPMALIQVDGGKQRAVRVGDRLSGHRVASISRRGVTLESNGQRTTLAFKGNADNE